MNTKAFGILFALVLVLSLSMVTAVPVGADGEVTIYYGDIELPSGGGFFLQLQMWDLNACDVTVSYTLDLSGAPNVANTGDYGQSGYVGLVYPGSTWAGAWMSGFLCDWDNSSTEFPTYPDNNDSQDMDDKFNMQRSPYDATYCWDERHYDVDCSIPQVVAEVGIPDAWSNYGIWFDRDGVDSYQANMWGMVDGGTYNTEGIYEVQLTYRKASPTKGMACPLFFPNLINEDAPGGYGIPTGFKSTGTGYQYFPYGISFDTDETKMAMMQVFVSGNPGNGTIVVRDLTVTGCLVLEEGTATGGGWFIPEVSSAHGLENLGGKATFGFVAKEKDNKSSGQLEFQYHDDDLELKSTSYDWVTLSNTQVIFEGTGRLDGIDGYKFRVWAFDGDRTGGQPDRFTIRIWTDSDSYESPTHRAEGDLGGGQIIVHKK